MNVDPDVIDKFRTEKVCCYFDIALYILYIVNWGNSGQFLGIQCRSIIHLHNEINYILSEPLRALMFQLCMEKDRTEKN